MNIIIDDFIKIKLVSKYVNNNNDTIISAAGDDNANSKAEYIIDTTDVKIRLHIELKNNKCAFIDTYAKHIIKS